MRRLTSTNVEAAVEDFAGSQECKHTATYACTGEQVGIANLVGWGEINGVASLA